MLRAGRVRLSWQRVLEVPAQYRAQRPMQSLLCPYSWARVWQAERELATLTVLAKTSVSDDLEISRFFSILVCACSRSHGRGCFGLKRHPDFSRKGWLLAES